MFTAQQKGILWYLVIFVFSYILFFAIISVLLRIVMTKQWVNTEKPNQLKHEGLIVIPEFITKDDIQKIKAHIENDHVLTAKQHIMQSPAILHKIKRLLGEDYVFQDYIFLIKTSQFHTCHRDYNGDFFNETQQHPSYTILIYLEDMNKCLDVIPKSHKSKDEYNFNLTDYTQTVHCKNGDAILFNANLIHNGSINEENSMRIQMKISHKSDHDVLKFYNDYNKVLDANNQTSTAFKHIQKHISCQFPIISYYAKQYDYNAKSDAASSSSVEPPDSGSGLFSSFFADLHNITEST